MISHGVKVQAIVSVQACLLGEAVEDSKSFGWKIPEGKSHDWSTMGSNVQARKNILSSLDQRQLEFKTALTVPSAN